ncbi:hypothetical protein Mapa_014429 [Marchantia paleacea]|nr:hypothetical protein Mapa_014429 [Marchantia paleacea]
MVFWGVEVKPGKPHTHSSSEDELLDGSTLHLSQATLGLEGKSKERAVVKCKVGDGPELLLCSLIPGVSESCSLDLLFDQDVTFSVVGSASVHLIGYYMPLEDEEGDDDDYDFDGVSEEDSDEDSDEEMDSEMEDDDRVPSGVTIEEIDEEAPSPAPLKLIKGKDDEPKPESKSAQKKRKKMEALFNATAKSKTPTGDAKKVETPAEAAGGDDSEDEDGFAKDAPNKKQAVKGADGTPLPAAAAAVAATTPVAAAPESAGKKKKNKKNKNKDAQTPGAARAASAAAATTPVAASTPAAEPAKTAEKPGNKAKENGTEKTTVKTPAPATNGSTPAAAATKSAKKGSPAVKKFPNGLEIQDVAMGKPDAKQAKPGKRVGMIYTGRLKSNGKIFDSNVGKKPFEFRLGVGEVIKGWDVGVNGMRIGDKRKLVIPPAMGYGAKGVGSTIPGNATLEFDVELVNVK